MYSVLGTYLSPADIDIEEKSTCPEEVFSLSKIDSAETITTLHGKHNDGG